MVVADTLLYHRLALIVDHLLAILVRRAQFCLNLDILCLDVKLPELADLRGRRIKIVARVFGAAFVDISARIE